MRVAETQDEARRRLAAHLRGDGVELGPGHQPFPVPDGVRVRYVDRWTPQDNRDRFPELVEIGVGDDFPPPDVVADFDVDRLAPLPDRSQDFVVCSHVLEHLAEPLGFLAEIHRVLRPGALALLLLPDRRRTFDSMREPTPLEHLVAEHRAGITEVDDEHLVDFLTNAGPGASYLGLPDDASERARWFAWHRERSIHVHCWTESEFVEVLAYAITSMGQNWSVVDVMLTDDQGPSGIEFGYVLRRDARTLWRRRRARRLVEALTPVG